MKYIIAVLSIYIASSTLIHANTQYKIKSTDNLSRIIKKHYPSNDLSQAQLFVGILAENPDAFRRGNINALLRGEVLNLPDITEMKLMSKVDASKLLSRHDAHFKSRKKSVLKPPFENYTARSNELLEVDKQDLEKKKQLMINLDKEGDQLRLRLDKLAADKEAIDAELERLNGALKR